MRVSMVTHLPWPWPLALTPDPSPPLLSLNSTGRRCGGVCLRPPWPGACGTLGRHVSGWRPSSIHSSTGGRWRWRRRRGRTCPRSACPGTRHTAGHPAHMASLPPGEGAETGDQWGLCKRVHLWMWRSSSSYGRHSGSGWMRGKRHNVCVCVCVCVFVCLYFLFLKPFI